MSNPNVETARTIEAAVRMLNQVRAITAHTVLNDLISPTMIAYIEAAIENGQSVDVAARLVSITN